MLANTTQRSTTHHATWFTLDSVIATNVLLLCLAIAACCSFQNDTWWLLRTGQVIVATKSIPTHDIYSWTARGADWPNHEWLTEVMFYGVYRMSGLVGLVAATFLVTVTTWALIYRMCQGAPRYRAIVVLLGLLVQVNVISVRPHMISFLFVALILKLIPYRRWHWLYPALFLVWANMHGGVAFGGATLAIILCVTWFTNPHERLRWLSICGASALATLLNPLGFGLWTYIYHAFHDPTRTLIKEWLPPSFDKPLSYPFFITAALWLFVVVRYWKQWCGQQDWVLVLVGAFFLVLGFRSMRHTAMFTLIAAPVISRALLATTIRPIRTNLWPLAALLTLGSAALGLSVVLQVWEGGLREPLDTPMITAVRTCEGPLYNSYDVGGFLIWSVPERPVFLDSRQDPYPGQLIADGLTVNQGTYQALFTRYGIRCAFITKDSPLAPRLQQDGWRTLAADTRFVVLQKP